MILKWPLLKSRLLQYYLLCSPEKDDTFPQGLVTWLHQGTILVFFSQSHLVGSCHGHYHFVLSLNDTHFQIGQIGMLIVLGRLQEGRSRASSASSSKETSSARPTAFILYHHTPVTKPTSVVARATLRNLTEVGTLSSASVPEMRPDESLTNRSAIS